MKIRLWSDVHVEFGPFTPKLNGREKETILVIAGDYGPGCLNDQMEALCNTFQHLIFVPGNHEYYHGVIEDTDKEFRQFDLEHPNFHFLNPGVRTIDKIRFIGASLWTDINRGNPLYVQRARDYMNDYRLIKRRTAEAKTYPLKPIDTMAINAEHRNFIKAELDKPFDGETVIVTHHGPIQKFVADTPKFRETSMFYGNNGLENWFFDYKIAAWCHGHTHIRRIDELNDVPIIRNPRGYVDYEPMASSFDSLFEFEVISR